MPERRRRYGAIMSDFTGPGRNSEMSTIRSSHRSGCSFCSSSRWPGDSIWKHPSVSEARIVSNVVEVVERDAVEVDLLPRRARDLVERVAHRAQHAHAEDVELQVAEQLDVVLVGLDHAMAVGAALQRHALDEVVAREHDAARMQRDVPGEPSDAFGHADQSLHLFEAQIDARQLGQAVDRLAQVPRRDVRERLRDDADLGVGHAEGLAHLADRRARAVGVDHRHAPGALFAVAAEDHVVDVLAPGGLHVDVDVGQVLAHRIHEPLERQVVAERVDVGDAGQVAHERAGGRSPARRPDAHRLHVGDDVGHREEVRREPHAPDHRELVVEPVAQALVLVHAPLVHPPPAPLGEHGIGAAARRRRELGEVDTPEPEVVAAPVGDLEGRVAQVGALREERAHLVGGLQPTLRVAARDVRLRERHQAPHALQHVGHERVAAVQVAHGVRRDGAHAGAIGEPQHRSDLVGSSRARAGARRRRPAARAPNASRNGSSRRAA